MQPARRVFSCGPRVQPQRRAFTRAVRSFSRAPIEPARSGLVALTSRRLVSLIGPDATKYLQGVITANLFVRPVRSREVARLRTDTAFYAAFLSPQGRLTEDALIYPDPTKSHGVSWLIEVDATQAAILRNRIRIHKLTSKFEVRILDEDEASVWHAWNDDPSFSPPRDLATPSAIVVRDPRAPGLGHRILTFPSGARHADRPPQPFASLPARTELDYRLRRYLRGVAEGQSELPAERAIPHESNLDLLAGGAAIDFRKGCYVGQELAVRTEHRGVVRKRVLPCLLYPKRGGEYPASSSPPPSLEALYRPEIGQSRMTAAVVPPDTSVLWVGGAGATGAAKWLRGVGNIGLAVCRLASMTDLDLGIETWGGEPYDPDARFFVSLGAGIQFGVRAFVPDWLREGLAAKRERWLERERELRRGG